MTAPGAQQTVPRCLKDQSRGGLQGTELVYINMLQLTTFSCCSDAIDAWIIYLLNSDAKNINVVIWDYFFRA